LGVCVGKSITPDNKLVATLLLMHIDHDRFDLSLIIYYL
jgi:hypothetical protein